MFSRSHARTFSFFQASKCRLTDIQLVRMYFLKYEVSSYSRFFRRFYDITQKMIFKKAILFNTTCLRHSINEKKYANLLIVS